MKKRIISLLLVLVTLFSMCIPVNAATWDPNAEGAGNMTRTHTPPDPPFLQSRFID